MFTYRIYYGQCRGKYPCILHSACISAQSEKSLLCLAICSVVFTDYEGVVRYGEGVVYLTSPGSLN